jgi:hypothetical protein
LHWHLVLIHDSLFEKCGNHIFTFFILNPQDLQNGGTINSESGIHQRAQYSNETCSNRRGQQSSS